jgi:hypothetical protein
MATIHLSKGAPKSTRLDAVALRKRAASKGDHVVEIKPGEEVLSVNVGWTVEKFVEAENGKKNGSVKKKEERGKKSAPAKKAVPPAKKAKTTAKKTTKAKPAVKKTSKARKKK